MRGHFAEPEIAGDRRQRVGRAQSVAPIRPHGRRQRRSAVRRRATRPPSTPGGRPRRRCGTRRRRRRRSCRRSTPGRSSASSPTASASLLHAIADAARLGQPVPFVLYWGKGPRCELAEPDTTCLDYLASLGSRVRQVYAPGASFKLIFTDTHAEPERPCAGSDGELFRRGRSAPRASAALTAAG